MLSILLISVILLYCGSGVHSEGLVEFLKWKQIDYEVPRAACGNYHHHHHHHHYNFHRRHFSRRLGTPDFTFPGNIKRYSNGQQNQMGQPDFDYIPYNNVPMGVTHYKGRLFITMPRRRPGIPATLNYIDITKVNPGDSPKLTGYPNYDINRLNPSFLPDPQRIISVYRTRLDSCNRLWFIDTGMLEYPDNRVQVQQPSIWIINLDNDMIVKRFEIPKNIVTDGRGLASITVDIDNNHCNEAYAYIPDLFHNQLHVYSLKHDRMWSFHHNYFSFDPLWGDLNIAGQSFQWDDGIFSITLGKKNPNGYKTAYFHPMVSTSEFAVSTKVLRNESNAERSYHGKDFQHLGLRGPSTQSTMHDYDPKTETIFFAEIAKYGVGCWNTNKPLSEQYHGTVQQDENKMIYPCDLTVDQDGVIWVMTNSMPLFIYSNLNPNEYNFRIWRQSSRDAAENTVCKA